MLTASGASRVAFIGVNGPAFPVLLFASALAGVPLAPLNYRLSTDQRHELLCELDNPLVVVDEDYLPMVAGASCAAVITSQEFAVSARSTAPRSGSTSTTSRRPCCCSPEAPP